MSDLLLPDVDAVVPPEGLPIGKVAEAIGVGVEALRYYEREGLMLQAAPRDSGGRRRYGERDVAWISGLVMLRQTGMPISDIRVIAELSRREGTEQERLMFFQEHRARVLERLDQTHRHLAAIDRKIDSYRAAQAGERDSRGRRPEAAPATDLHAILSAWWEAIAALDLDSPQKDWDAMTSYLADDCVVYFGGMGSPATVGVGAVDADLRKILTYWRLVERRVLTRGADAAGTTIFASMNNRLEILGEALDFPETEVVTFDEEGRIARYELYCDPAPIAALIAARRPAA